jgi:hypothetical protein
MGKQLCIALAKRNEEIPELLTEVSSNLKLSKADTFAYILRKYQTSQQEKENE